MVGRRLASGGRIDRGRPHLGPDGSGEQTFPGDSPTAVFVASGAMVAGLSDAGRPRGVVRDGQIAGPTLDAAVPSAVPGPGCDVLVVGAGPAGLSAALTAARTGLRVIVVDRGPGPGGAMLSDAEIRWAGETVDELRDLDAGFVFSAEVLRVAPADTDGSDGPDGPDSAGDPTGSVTVVLRLPHGSGGSGGGPEHTVTVGRVVLATGAVERSALFPGNGAPGVMPAEQVRALLLRYGVLAGEQVVLLTGHDDAYRVAGDLLAVGAAVAVVDARPDPDGGPDATFPAKSYDPIPTGAVLHRAAVTGVVTDDAGVVVGVRLRATDGTSRSVPADLVAVSGGWNPELSLFTAAGGRVAYDPERGAYLPESDLERLHVVGAARGLRTNAECVADGAGAGALKGLSGELVVLPPPVDLEAVRTPPVVLTLPIGLHIADPSEVLLDPSGGRTLADLPPDAPTAAGDRLGRLLAAPAAGLPAV